MTYEQAISAKIYHDLKLTIRHIPALNADKWIELGAWSLDVADAGVMAPMLSHLGVRINAALVYDQQKAIIEYEYEYEHPNGGSNGYQVTQYVGYDE